MIGFLVVYVYGYRVDDWRCLDHNNPPQLTQSKGWINDDAGWAFGDNPRGRYCSIHNKKIRKFDDFDAAIDAIYLQQQKKRRGERYQLIYRVKREVHEVSTEADIEAIDALISAEDAELARHLAERNKEYERERPERHRLRERHGLVMAGRLSEFLGQIRELGFDRAVENLGVAKATAYRYKRLLRDEGLL